MQHTCQKPHIEHGVERSFYVDFIVMQKAVVVGVGLFDTKGGLTAETAKSRAEGLAKHIAEQNKKGKKIIWRNCAERKNSYALSRRAEI